LSTGVFQLPTSHTLCAKQLLSHMPPHISLSLSLSLSLSGCTTPQTEQFELVLTHSVGLHEICFLVGWSGSREDGIGFIIVLFFDMKH